MNDHAYAIYAAALAGVLWELANRIDKPSGHTWAIIFRSTSFALCALSFGLTLLSVIPLIR